MAFERRLIKMSGKIEQINPKTIGKRLRKARRSARILQAVAAESLGCGRTTLVAIEQGQRTVSASEMIVLCKLYKADMSDIVRPEPKTLKGQVIEMSAHKDRRKAYLTLVCDAEELKAIGNLLYKTVNLRLKDGDQDA